MRLLALAAIASLGLAGPADARVWTDPAGRLVFDAPATWVTTQERGAQPGETFTYVISGNANNECQFIAQPSPGTAGAAADSVRRAGLEEARFTAELWTRTLNSIGSVFPNNSAAFLSRSMETDGFWPIQRAEIQSPERLVHAAIQLRPGFDLIALCMTYDGADPTDLYDRVIRSVGHPNDSALRADAERLQAERDAVAAAPAQPEQPPPRRNRN